MYDGVVPIKRSDSKTKRTDIRNERSKVENPISIPVKVV
jgi:hypothetical protein